MPDFPADAFVGTAPWYARYRPSYPRALFDHLLARLGPSAKETLVDLGCGPGRATLPLAPLFHQVIAIDREPEMIVEARKQAAARAITNVDWRVCRAEELELPLGSVDLIIVGDAFHRLDQKRTIASARAWLKPGGAFANLGSHPRDPHAEWQSAMAKVVAKYRRSLVPGETPATEKRSNVDIVEGEQTLVECGFTEVQSFTFLVPHVWTLESLRGHLASTSFCSNAVLRDRAADFDRAFAAALAPFGPAYEDELLFGYTFARQPSPQSTERTA